MSRAGHRRFLPPLAAAALLLACCATAWAQGDGDPLSARAFPVRYRPLADAADVVAPLLSANGTVTLRPRLRMLVVQDREEVLDRVEALLSSFDLPPRNVEVTLSLFLGTDRLTAGRQRGAPGQEFSKEVRGVIETLGDVTKWIAYEPLGSRSVTGTEGGAVTAELSLDYRVVLEVDSVHSSGDVVKFERVSLQRTGQDEEGAETVEDLYSAGMVLTAGRVHVVGAAREPGSNRALFLILEVKAR
jgi:hypothetical protein